MLRIFSRVLINDINVFLLFTATEYRNWLLHYSVPVLKGVLPNQYFIHYTLFVTAISILVSDQISLQKLQQADKLLDNFCKLMPELYGEYILFIILNVNILNQFAIDNSIALHLFKLGC